jgi:hypothetical protein
MSIHKLTAGSGYDYLTRQVAALDATEKGHLGLASYYTERGETPGVWMGSGMAGIDELNPGDVVTAEQMRALFGAGLHPLAEQRQRQLQGPELTARDYQAVTRLGRRSRSTSLTCRRSGSRWRNGSPPSTRPPGCPATARYRWRIGRRIRTEVAMNAAKKPGRGTPRNPPCGLRVATPRRHRVAPQRHIVTGYQVAEQP